MTNINLQNKRYQGFTLIESLIVLTAAILLLGLPLIIGNQTKENVIAAQFFSSLEKHLLFTQQMAIVGGKDGQIFFSAEDRTIVFSFASGKEQLSIPKDLSASGPSIITFKNGSGNNSQLSRYSFDWKEKGERIVFQFQMGSGRFVKKISQL